MGYSRTALSVFCRTILEIYGQSLGKEPPPSLLDWATLDDLFLGRLIAAHLEAERIRQKPPSHLTPKVGLDHFGLGSRECDILRALARGEPIGDLARRLFCTASMLEQEITGILDKLNAEARVSALPPPKHGAPSGHRASPPRARRDRRPGR
jgi:DNA-binding CsgD family transcriptional regulator